MQLHGEVNREIINMKTENEIKEEVISKIKTIFDPELPVNIWDLGLIYEVNVVPINNVQVVMTLTAPNCPAAQSLPHDVDQKIREVEGINDVFVEITWSPAWTKDLMSEEAKLELGFL
ncbi:MAG: FeS assembly SUF system protein [Chitinophagaceae bacterium]|nr:MAG: FeS assembly SUF system protein [Chitinophagaceae bacterium]